MYQGAINVLYLDLGRNYINRYAHVKVYQAVHAYQVHM